MRACVCVSQIRLCLLVKDYIRAHIIAKKIDRAAITDKSLQTLKIKFYKLLIEYHTHENQTLDLCRRVHTLRRTIPRRWEAASAREAETGCGEGGGPQRWQRWQRWQAAGTPTFALRGVFALCCAAAGISWPSWRLRR